MSIVNYFTTKFLEVKTLKEFKLSTPNRQTEAARRGKRASVDAERWLRAGLQQSD